MRSGGAQNVKGNSRVLIYLFFLHYIVPKDMELRSSCGAEAVKGDNELSFGSVYPGNIQLEVPSSGLDM